MQRELDRYRMLSRRAILLAGAKTVLLTTLFARMRQLQIVEGERYTTLADDNRINVQLLAPPRGRILDRFGRPLAVNRANYRVLMFSEKVKDLERTLESLSAVLVLSEDERARILRDIRRKQAFIPITVRDNLSWSELSRVEVNRLDLPGVIIDVGHSRSYPNVEAPAHLLGYVGAVSEAEQGQDDDPLLKLPYFQVGKAGAERFHDLALRGKAGSSQVEVNAVGRVIREMSRREGMPGEELALTIDLALQKYTIERIGTEHAAVVVIEVNAGEILAMASTPSFDPNVFATGISGETWNALLRQPGAPLTNKCITGQYAPCSTFKMMPALAALEGRIVDPEQRFFCSGRFALGNALFHCWKKEGHGWMAMEDGIRQSCDVYFYEVSRRVGVDKIAAMAQRFGLGRPVEIDLPGERAGLIPTRQWKLKATGEPWQPGENLVVGIGQGFVLATPLQLAVMVARLANGGAVIKPRLTRRIGAQAAGADGASEDNPRVGVSLVSLSLVRRAMEAVVNHRNGTAYRARIEEPEYAMAGKTGTSQVTRITRAERERGLLKPEDMPWEERDHALFVGFAPLHAPRYGIAVVVEHGGGGSRMAAPIARDILREAQRLKSANERESEVTA